MSGSSAGQSPSVSSANSASIGTFCSAACASAVASA